MTNQPRSELRERIKQSVLPYSKSLTRQSWDVMMSNLQALILQERQAAVEEMLGRLEQESWGDHDDIAVKFITQERKRLESHE